MVGVDGAQWIFEGVKDSTYHVVDRWSPDNGESALSRNHDAYRSRQIEAALSGSVLVRLRLLLDH